MGSEMCIRDRGAANETSSNSRGLDQVGPTSWAHLGPQVGPNLGSTWAQRGPNLRPNVNPTSGGSNFNRTVQLVPQGGGYTRDLSSTDYGITKYHYYLQPSAAQTQPCPPYLSVSGGVAMGEIDLRPALPRRGSAARTGARGRSRTGRAAASSSGLEASREQKRAASV